VELPRQSAAGVKRAPKIGMALALLAGAIAAAYLV
jgi:hypothetical protein